MFGKKKLQDRIAFLERKLENQQNYNAVLNHMIDELAEIVIEAYNEGLKCETKVFAETKCGVKLVNLLYGPEEN